MEDRTESKTYADDERQLVTFQVGKETFAVDVNQVRVISRVGDITHVPRMPSFIEGVMNLRGQITTVIDLRRRFDIDTELDEDVSEQARIIVAEVGETQIGIIVDAVQDVMRVPAESISPPPKMIQSSVDARFLTGICRLTDQLIMLLDLSRVLSEEEMEQVIDKNQSMAAQPTIETNRNSMRSTEAK